MQGPALCGRDPDPSSRSLLNGSHIAVDQARGSAIYLKTVPVETGDSSPGMAEPDHSPGIFHEGSDPVQRQPVFRGEVFEAHPVKPAHPAFRTQPDVFVTVLDDCENLGLCKSLRNAVIIEVIGL